MNNQMILTTVIMSYLHNVVILVSFTDPKPILNRTKTKLYA